MKVKVEKKRVSDLKNQDHEPLWVDMIKIINVKVIFGQERNVYFCMKAEKFDIENQGEGTHSRVTFTDVLAFRLSY
jgi:hypothetical protein